MTDMDNSGDIADIVIAGDNTGKHRFEKKGWFYNGIWALMVCFVVAIILLAVFNV